MPFRISTFPKWKSNRSSSSLRQEIEMAAPQVFSTSHNQSQIQEVPAHQTRPSENNNNVSLVQPTTDHNGPAQLQSNSEDSAATMIGLSVNNESSSFGPSVIVRGPLLKVGPFGGDGGGAFDDGIHDSVKQITISHDWGIYSINIKYVKEGGSCVWSRHGEDTSGNNYTIKLNYPAEYLVSLWGFKGLLRGLIFVRSITFQSNQKTYGPFGVEEGTYFLVPQVGSKIVGFHGRSGRFLDSIGAYFPPLSHS